MDQDGLTRLLERQDGVATTAQLRALGATEPWIGRRIRSGQWQRPFRGVVVTHSGPMSWRNRFRAALLHAGRDAVLSHETAAYLHGFRLAPPAIVVLTVPAHRTVTTARGLRVHRSRLLGASGTPLSGWVPPGMRAYPRTSFADTALDLAARARTQDEVVACLAEAVRARTPPSELRAALDRRRSQPGRALLDDLLADVAVGIESPLEYRYHRLARAHGLPRAQLQVRQLVDDRWIRADRIYGGLGVRVELDGRLGHPGGRTDQDTWRDNAVLLAHDELTLRYRWSHVVGQPCETAGQVAQALITRGWAGRALACHPGCPAPGR